MKKRLIPLLMAIIMLAGILTPGIQGNIAYADDAEAIGFLCDVIYMKNLRK